MVFTTEGFFEVAIESWPEWNLNLRPLNSVQEFNFKLFHLTAQYMLKGRLYCGINETKQHESTLGIKYVEHF